mmetsp:Transcript_6476/g.7404  ORF Transcript_6476/g.7404 Transcript_6476/m.7404 type:complete len:250 (+) Transcript_6476:192-941(+)
MSLSTILGGGLSSKQLQRTGISFLCFHLIQWFASKTVPKHFDFKSSKKWTDAWVGLAHHFVVCSASLYVIFNNTEPEINEDRMYGFSDRCNLIYAIATSYFLWDINTCLVQGLTDAKVYIHAAVCTLCYLFSQHPYLHYYGVRFLLFEISSVFMQLRQILLLLELQKTSLFRTIQMMFGLSFMATRIFYGLWLSSSFWIDSIDLLRNGKPHSVFVVVFYFVANVILCSLNILWMGMMINKYRKPAPLKS